MTIVTKNQQTRQSNEDTIASATYRHIEVAFDAEWDGERDLPIAIGFSLRDGETKKSLGDVFVLNTLVKGYIGNDDALLLKLIKHCESKGLVFKHVPFLDSQCAYQEVLDLLGLRADEHTGILFYSPKDLEYAFGWDNVKPLWELGGKKSTRTQGLVQKRNIKGKKLKPSKGLTLSFHDLKGWTNGSLRALAQATGVELADKGLMDDYKSHMLDGLLASPEDFVDYTMGDVSCLHTIRDNFTSNILHIAREVIGIDVPEDYELPQTTGSLVASVFELWLNQQVSPELKTAYEYAIRKLGILDPTAKGHKVHRKIYNQLTHAIRRPSDIETHREKVEKLIKSVQFEVLGYSQCSVNYLARIDTTLSVQGIVQGGRCNNEKPTSYSIGVGADIDLQGCYGSKLRDYIYPVGLPTVLHFTENEERITLKDFLNQNESDFIPGLWQCHVEGDLGFSQDLIYSTWIEWKDIVKAANGGFDKEFSGDHDDTRDDDIKHIPGHFCLLQKQIKNGIITHDVLEVLRAVTTNVEYSELMKLEVVSAAWFPESLRVEDIDQWTKEVISDKGSRKANRKNGVDAVDTRTRKWCGVPMQGFVGDVLEERGRVKKLAKTDPSMEGLNQSLKLFVNTLYGCLASPFFPIGNTVVANNITAAARVGVWQLNKALGTVQSITDGGMYDLSTVRFMDTSKGNFFKPGLETLSDYDTWVNGRLGRTVGSLDGKDWTANYSELVSRIKSGEDSAQILKDLGDVLDEASVRHLNEFWGVYGLSVKFDIEHKGENSFTTAAYWSRADYAMKTLTGKIKFKIRGTKAFNDEPDLKRSPMYDLLESIINGSDIFPDLMNYNHFSLLKAGLWYKAQKSRGYVHLDGKRPGDGVISIREKSFNNTHMPCTTYSDRSSRDNRKTSKTVDGELVRLPLFERYADRGIKYVHKQMLDNRLR